MIVLPRRSTRVVGYGLFSAAGVAALVWSVPSVQSAGGPIIVWAWGLSFAVGGAVACAGSATDRWLGELAGLPLLAAVFIVWGLSVLAQGRSVAYAAGVLLVAVGAVLWARWRDVDVVRREAGRQAQRERR